MIFPAILTRAPRKDVGELESDAQLRLDECASIWRQTYRAVQDRFYTELYKIAFLDFRGRMATENFTLSQNKVLFKVARFLILFLRMKWAIGSGVERCLHTAEVTGSKPVSPTI